MKAGHLRPSLLKGKTNLTTCICFEEREIKTSKASVKLRESNSKNKQLKATEEATAKTGPQKRDLQMDRNRQASFGKKS